MNKTFTLTNGSCSSSFTPRPDGTVWVSGKGSMPAGTARSLYGTLLAAGWRPGTLAAAVERTPAQIREARAERLRSPYADPRSI